MGGPDGDGVFACHIFCPATDVCHLYFTVFYGTHPNNTLSWSDDLSIPVLYGISFATPDEGEGQ